METLSSHSMHEVPTIGAGSKNDLKQTVKIQLNLRALDAIGRLARLKALGSCWSPGHCLEPACQLRLCTDSKKPPKGGFSNQAIES
jgi:hypothetical protein